MRRCGRARQNAESSRRCKRGERRGARGAGDGARGEGVESGKAVRWVGRQAQVWASRRARGEAAERAAAARVCQASCLLYGGAKSYLRQVAFEPTQGHFWVFACKKSVEHVGGTSVEYSVDQSRKTALGLQNGRALRERSPSRLKREVRSEGEVRPSQTW